MKNNKIRVSFDFDSTLGIPSIQKYAKYLVERGIEVWICTTRKTAEQAKNPTWNDDIFKVADEVGIKREHIIFTNLEMKVEFLKDKNFLMHLDDDWTELKFLENESDVQPVNVFGNPDWKSEAEAIVNLEMEYILCSAIWFDDEKQYTHQPRNIKTGFVVTGHRHHNCFQTLAILTGRDEARLDFEKEQGFLTNTNRFVGRNEALNIARGAGQIDWNYKENWETARLFSEDLY